MSVSQHSGSNEQRKAVRVWDDWRVELKKEFLNTAREPRGDNPPPEVILCHCFVLILEMNKVKVGAASDQMVEDLRYRGHEVVVVTMTMVLYGRHIHGGGNDWFQRRQTGDVDVVLLTMIRFKEQMLINF